MVSCGMARRMFHKVMVCLLTVFVTLGLNLPLVEAIAAPMQTQTTATMDMQGMNMKGITDTGSKGVCPHCPDMGGTPMASCGVPCAPLLADNVAPVFKQATPSSTIYLIANLALKGRSFAPETGPPRTLAHV